MSIDDASPAEIAEALSHMLHAAKREIPRHRKSELHDPLTPYDERHRDLDDLVTNYLRVKAKQPA